ncbi:MAG: uroporphyrinogen-III synthase [Candidatus Promineifilaceae bacterium]|nr:uroporphyrinogen-III synthase [Candidatus Promineifilaceae bacterium]
MVDAPRVVVTRRAEQAGHFCGLLRAAGFTPVRFPVIQLQALPGAGLDAALADLKRFAWLIFSSSNAVDFFFERAGDVGAAVLGPRIAAVGPATAQRLRRYQVEVDFVPQRYTGEFLAAGLGDLEGQEVLIPRARQGRPELVATLRDQGAMVTEVALYDTVTAVPELKGLNSLSEGYEAVTFASPSSVRGFLQICGQVEPDAVVACIGPVTAAAAQKAGLKVTIVPDEYTLEGLVDSLVRYYG